MMCLFISGFCVVNLLTVVNF